MIVFPLIRSVGLKAATASSRVAMLPMFVRSRPSRTRMHPMVAGATFFFRLTVRSFFGGVMTRKSLAHK